MTGSPCPDPAVVRGRPCPPRERRAKYRSGPTARCGHGDSIQREKGFTMHPAHQIFPALRGPALKAMDRACGGCLRSDRGETVCQACLRRHLAELPPNRRHRLITRLFRLLTRPAAYRVGVDPATGPSRTVHAPAAGPGL